MSDAVVVGSGPNGLAAAVLLARAGVGVEVYEAAGKLGGGCRTEDLTLPGYHHDSCAGAHPMAVSSPFFRAFDLAAHGVEMLRPEISYGHPLDGGRAAVAWRDLDRTVADLGSDGPAWRRIFEPLVRNWEAVVDVAMSDLRRPPRNPLTAARFFARLAEQASPLWDLRLRDRAAALFTGVSAHAIMPPRSFAPAGVGLLLGTLGHCGGWAIPRGGSQAIVDAMAADIERHGGRIHTGHRVDSLDEFPAARAVLLDTAPTELLRIAPRLPDSYRNRLRRFRYGGAACKVDFALSGPVPWQAAELAAAGTLHVAGTRAEIVAAERAVAAGRHAGNPFVLVIQPGVVDEGRAPGDNQTLYSYVHVPNGSERDVSAQAIDQIERFAPGFRDLIQAVNVRTAADMPVYNANYVGGDIGSGAMTLRQTVFRPTPRWNPHSTPLSGVYLCSSGTAPGAGVHGMCGTYAATHALRDRFGIRTPAQSLLSAPARG
ncbi:MAG: NAD(P)/FAD-dependent oxidoreductase [Nocardia sp.]|nr:NAD(P)/FAD-dependent oxidoreductase [Nocardia sp.]